MAKTNENSRIRSEDIGKDMIVKTSEPLDMNKRKQSEAHDDEQQQEEQISLSSFIEPKRMKTDNDRTILIQDDCRTAVKTAMEKNISGYSTISDDELKERFLTVISTDHRRYTRVRQLLETDATTLPYIRQHICLIAPIYPLKIEENLYKNYLNLTERGDLWLSQMSQTMMKYHRINGKFFQIQFYVKNQLKTIEYQLRRAMKTLIEHTQQARQVSTISAIDRNVLWAATTSFAREDQQRFHGEVEKKKNLLMLNANDVLLLKQFLDLKPTSQQKDIAGRIWQATIDEQRAKNSFNKVQQGMSHTDEDPLHGLRRSSSTYGTTASPLPSSSKTAANTEAKGRSRRELRTNTQEKAKDYAQHMEMEKKTFLARSDGPLSTSHSQSHLHSLMAMIESRQQILKQNIQFNRDFHKIFFNDDRDDHSDDDDDGKSSVRNFGSNTTADMESVDDNDSMKDYLY